MNKKNPLVSIIIVNWNGGVVFENCLKSLSKLKYPNWELIVVDNNSKDKSDTFPKKIIKGVTVVRSKKNLGFAGGNNEGYKKAKGKYVLLLNNDTTVAPDFINVLVSKMESDFDLTVVQPKIYFMDKSGRLDNAGSFLTRTGFLQHWGFGKQDSKEFDRQREVFSTKGACMLIRKSVIDEVGLFDPEFVSYMEESDFCWRVWLNGGKVLYYPKTYIYHKVGMTSKRLDQVQVNFHSFKNRIRSLIKNLGLMGLVTVLVPHLLLSILLALFWLVRLQFDKSKMVVDSILWNIKHLGSSLRLRKEIQSKYRRVDDKTLFKKIMVKVSITEMFSHFVHIEGNFMDKKLFFPQSTPIIGRIRLCLEHLLAVGVKNKVVVDVGSSYGWLQKEIADKGAKRVIGIDPNDGALKIARQRVKGADFLKGDAANIPLKNSYADIITFFDVIEHVPKGFELIVLKEINRVLKKGGKLLLSTPNSNVLNNLSDPAWYFGHRHYTTAKIKKLLIESKFKVKNIKVKGGLFSSLYIIWLYVSKWIFRTTKIWKKVNEIYDKSYDKGRVATIFAEVKKTT